MGIGWERRKGKGKKGGEVGALTMTKDLGEGLHLHCILPRASPDIKEVYGFTQLYCTSLQLFITLLFLFTRDTSESVSQLFILITLMTDTDRHGLPHTKVWGVTYKCPFCPQTPPPIPTVMPEIHREPSSGYREDFPDFNHWIDYVSHYFCQICMCCAVFSCSVVSNSL